MKISRRSAIAGGCAVGVGALAPSLGAAKKLDVDLLIHGGRVYTMDDRDFIYPDGAIAVRADKIVAVGPTAELKTAYSAKKEIDARGHLVLPGLVDTHLHPVINYTFVSDEEDPNGFSYPRDKGFELSGSINPLAHGAGFRDFRTFISSSQLLDRVPPAVTYALSLQAMLIAVQGGATTFIEGGGGSVAGVAGAARRLGMRAGVAHAVVDSLPGQDGTPMRVADTDTVLAKAEAAAKQWSNSDGLLTGWYNVVTDATATDALLRGVGDLSVRQRIPVTSHTAATRAQEAYVRASFGKSSVARVADLGLMDFHWLGIHMGFFSEDDIPILKARGGHIAHCPGTSSYTGKALMREGKVLEAARAGVPVGLGSDTVGAGNMFQQMRLAYAGHREAKGDDRVIEPYTVLNLATRAAAACAHLKGVTGQLVPGLKADIILIDADTPALAMKRRPLNALLSRGSARDVRTSIINGAVVMENRQFPGLDADEVGREMRIANAALSRVVSGG